MDINPITYIVAIVTILGFILNVRDVFPTHRETRKKVVFFALGIFIGTLLGSFVVEKVAINIPINGFTLLVGSFAIVLVFMVVVAIFSKQERKRNQLLTFSGMALYAFLGLLWFGSYINRTSRDSYDIDEIMHLSQWHSERANYDRAIELLEEAEIKVGASDPRDSLLQQAIIELKEEQVTSNK